uniref:Xylulose kinase-1 n=1 Tax=Tanacetum cinerariifolium TaxID=118510 RepID=A0A6L2JKS9_TANCI|nr:xylulose kinase-1 [Tanacetum cinerariifolium]
MALTFADTHNMIAYLTKSDASEGFDQIIDFLNTSSIKYALTVNPNIYVSCIKQFWSSVLVKKVNDVTRLQALVDKKNVIITKATIREALRLDDAESIDCLPNEEIFTELSRMGVRKGFSRVDTPSFKGMIMAQQDDDVADEDAASVDVDDVPAAADEPTIPSQQDKVAQSLEITKLKQRVKKLKRRNKLKVSKLKRLKRVGTSQRVDTFDDTGMDDVSKQGRIIASMDADVDVTLKDVADIAKEVAVDTEIKDSADDDKVEPAELQKVVDVVTTAKLVTEMVTAASATITVATTSLIAAAITTASSAARRRKGVVIRDPEETTTPSIIIHSESKSKDKGKGILVEEPKPLKKLAQIEQDEANARELEAELNKIIN